RGGQVHDPGQVRRGDGGRPEGDLLPDRRDARADRELAVPGGVPGEGTGGAAADPPHRRGRETVAARGQGQKAEGGGQGRGGRGGGRRRDEKGVRAAARLHEGEARRGEGRAPVEPAEGERRVPGGRGGGDGGTPGAAAAAGRARQGGAGQQADPGSE